MPSTLHFVRIVAIAAALSAGWVSAAAAGPASQLIEQFNLAFVDIIRADDRQVLAGQPGRYRRLSNHMSENFDLDAMMERAAGAYWMTAGDPERAQAIDAFLRINVATYLSRFETYSGEYFTLLGEEQARDGDVRVLTKLIRPGRINVPVTYVVRPSSNGFGEMKIVDVIFVGGTSEITRRRSEFAEILTRRGLLGLTARLHEQADRIVAELRAPLQRDAAARTLAAFN
jgi:ABC-type transporter MlaC component